MSFEPTGTFTHTSRPFPTRFRRHHDIPFRCFTPEKAIDYRLIDRIVQPEEGVAMDAKDYEGAQQQIRSHRQGRVALGAGGPEAGSA